LRLSVRSGLILIPVALLATAARADQGSVRSRAMSYTACLAAMEQIVQGTRFSRLLTTRDVRVVRIETEAGTLLITCDRLEARMTVRQAQGSKG
jgi:hypothetical protein